MVDYNALIPAASMAIVLGASWATMRREIVELRGAVAELRGAVCELRLIVIRPPFTRSENDCGQ
jgi:hypothetical protein